MIGRWSFVPGKPVVRGYTPLPCSGKIAWSESANFNLSQAEKEYAATEEHLRQRKKEFGWID